MWEHGGLRGRGDGMSACILSILIASMELYVTFMNMPSRSLWCLICMLFINLPYGKIDTSNIATFLWNFDLDES